MSALSGLLLPVATILLAGALFALPFERDPASALLRVASGLLVAAQVAGLVAGILLWIGVRSARNLPDIPGGRIIIVTIWALTILSLTGALGSIASSWDAAGLPVRLRDAAIGIANSLVGAALTIAVLNGVRAGEQPVAGWRVLGVSRVIVFVGWLATPLVAFAVSATGAAFAMTVAFGEMLSLIAAFGLATAFALGFPADERG
jgi:hypothetical protein